MDREDHRTRFQANRRRARELALQVLFEAEFSAHDPSAVLGRRLEEEKLPKPVASYAEILLSGAWEHRDRYDRLISQAAPTWPLEQMARIDRNVLRVALFEMIDGKEVPVKAAINEAVELAKEYGSDTSGRFVNGVLGTIATEVEGTIQ